MKASSRRRIFIGTCGYSYGEWVDAGFYPQGTHSSNMLDVYTEKFGATELNYTWYQMPRAPSLERMCAKLPSHFKVAAKLTRTMTHEVRQENWKEQVQLFRQGIAPLVEDGKLLCILIQLPPYFDRSVAHRNYLAALMDELSGLPLAVEFRHKSWAVDRVFHELEKRNVALVNVDVPNLETLFPPTEVVTCRDLFYIRLHGRNAKGWRTGNMQQQFNYDYSDQELESWAQSIQHTMLAKAESGGIFFNNHVRGQAPKNAAALIRILSQNGLGRFLRI